MCSMDIMDIAEKARVSTGLVSGTDREGNSEDHSEGRRALSMALFMVSFSRGVCRLVLELA